MTKIKDEEAKYNRTLRENIVKYFSLGEFNILCDDLVVDPEELKGGEKIEKVNELIKYMHRYGQINDLVDMLKSVRPKVNWEKDTIGTDSENTINIQMVSHSRASRDQDIHKLKRTARKIDMAGISLKDFWEEITHDPDQKMINRIVNEDIRFRVIFVHPDAAYLTQRWVEDDKESLDELRDIQKDTVELCVTFYKNLTNYYHSNKNSPLKPKDRFKVKLTKFLPIFLD